MLYQIFFNHGDEFIDKFNCKALKELEKGTPHKDVARMFEVPKNTLPTWKKKQRKDL